MLIVPSGLEGPEDRHLFPFLHTAMVSFYYLDTEAEQLEVAAQDHGLDVIVDSGAHTWQSDHMDAADTAGNYAKREGRKTNTSIEKADEYFERYINWIKRHWRHIYRFVELDIGALVGPDKVQAWYDRIREEGLASKCIRVWHDDHYDASDFRRMVDDTDSGFVGTEGPSRCHGIGSHLKYAYEQGVKVHGFGVSGRTLRKYPFYSVDSTTYKMGAQFGVYHYFDEEDGYLHHGHWRDPEDHQGEVDIQRAFRAHMLRQNGREVTTDDRKKQRRARFQHSLREFRKYERFLTRLWRKRGVKWEEDPTPFSASVPTSFA